jgi:replicative DNA helicase
MEAGETYIIHGQTSTFKSVAAQSILQNNLLAGKRGAIFSIEMNHRQMIKRLVASMGKISLKSMRTGRYDKGELDRFVQTTAQVKKLPLRIYDGKRNAMTGTSIVSEIRNLKRNFGLEMVVIDYAQLVSFGKGGDERRCAELQSFSKELKRLSVELDIVTILVAQANKEGQVSDSPQVESDGDGVLNMIPIIETVNNQRKVAGVSHIFVQKFREGRRGWKFPVRTFGQYATIEESQEVVTAKEF